MQLPYGAPSGGIYFEPASSYNSSQRLKARNRSADIVRRLQARMGHSLELPDVHCRQTGASICRSTSCECFGNANASQTPATNNCDRFKLRLLNEGAAKSEEKQCSTPKSSMTNCEGLVAAQLRMTSVQCKHEALPHELIREKRRSSSTGDLPELSTEVPGDYNDAEQVPVNVTTKQPHDAVTPHWPEPGETFPDDFAQNSRPLLKSNNLNHTTE